MNRLLRIRERRLKEGDAINHGVRPLQIGFERSQFGLKPALPERFAYCRFIRLSCGALAGLQLLTS